MEIHTQELNLKVIKYHVHLYRIFSFIKEKNELIKCKELQMYKSKIIDLLTHRQDDN